jgi:hypothetical protein
VTEDINELTGRSLSQILSAGGASANDNSLDFDTWDKTSAEHIDNKIDKLRGYGNYLREYELDRGFLDGQTEYTINEVIKDSIRKVDPDYELPAYGGSVDSDAAMLGMAFGEERKQNYYDAISNGASRDDFIDVLNDAKTYLVETDQLKLASLQRTNEDGETYFEIIGNGNAGERDTAIKESLNLGALRYRDLWQTPIGYGEEYEGVNRFQAARYAKIQTELANSSQSRNDEKLYDEVVQEAKDYFDKKPQDRDDPAALVTKARTLLGNNFAKGKEVPSDVARNRFQDAEIIDVLEQVAVYDKYQKGEVKYITDDQRLHENIKVTNNKVAVPHLRLLTNRTEFQLAVEQKIQKGDLTERQKDFLENNRRLYLTNNYEAYDELFKGEALGDKWVAAKIEGAQAGKDNVQILDDFLDNPQVYSSIGNKFRAIADSVGDSFSGLAFVLPALFGNKNAIDFLVEQEERRVNRRQVAQIYGDKFGIGMDVATTLTPALVDIGATALASSATFGAGGVLYLGSKQGAKITAKGYVKSIVGTAFLRQFGETGEQAALRLATKNKVLKLSEEGVVSKGVADAIDSYNNMIANKTIVNRVQNSAIFVTSANRSAGSTYATVYSNLDGDHAEKHDKALGAALMAGAATGLITTGFSAIGKGGFENALLRGLTFNQQKFALERLSRSKLTRLDAENLIRETVGTRIKEITRTGFGDLYQRFVKAGTEEFVEEAIDEFVNSFIVDAALDRNTPMIEKISGSLYAGLIGGIIGQGASAARAIKDRRDSAVVGQLAEFQKQEETKIIEALRKNKSPITAALVEDRVRSLLRGPAGTAISPEDEVAVQEARAELKGVNPDEIYVGDEGVEISSERMEQLIPEVDVAQMASNLENLKSAQETEVIEEALNTESSTIDDEEFINTNAIKISVRQDKNLEATEDKVFTFANEEELNKEIKNLEEQLIPYRDWARTQEAKDKLKSEGENPDTVSFFDTKFNLEQKLKSLQEFQDKANQQILKSQIEEIPESDFDSRGLDKADEALKTNVQGILGDLIKRAESFDVEVRLVDQKARDDAKERGDELKTFQLVTSTTGSYILIDPIGIAAFAEGRSTFSTKSLTRALMSEEIAHAAVFNELSRNEIKDLYNTLPSYVIQKTIDTYYTNEADRASANERLNSTDANVVAKEVNTITQELLRMETQKALRGFTSEEDYAFYRNNPSILSILLRYFKGMVRRLSNALKRDPNNPSLSMAINRIVKTHTHMRKGGTRDILPSFDPNNPKENIAIFASQINTNKDEPLEPTEGINDFIESQVDPEEETKSKLLMRFGDLTGMLELPMLYSGRYRGKYEKSRKWLNTIVGSEDPRLRKLYENEIQLRNAVFDEIELYRERLEELVQKEYPDGNPPVALFKAITGEEASTRLNSKNVEQIEGFFRKRAEELDILKQNEMKTATTKEAQEDIALKYKALFEILDARKTDTYNNAFEEQRARLNSERIDAIEQMGGFVEDGVTEPKRTPKGELAAHLLSLREKVDAFSKKIKELYPNDPEASQGLGATIDQNLGIYITRSYKLFTEAGYARKVMENEEYALVRENAVKFFTDEYVTNRGRILYTQGNYNKNGEVIKISSLADAEAIARAELTQSAKGEQGMPAIIENIMVDYLASFAPNDSQFDLPIPSNEWKKNSTSVSKIVREKLMQRKDVPSVLRDLLGEEKDATGYNGVMRTYMHVSIMAAHQAFLRNVFQFGRAEENKWILSEDELRNLPPEEKYKNPDAADLASKEPLWEVITASSSKGDARFDPFLSEGTRLYAPRDLITSIRNIADSMSYSLNDADVVVSNVTKAMAQLTGGSMALKTLGSVGFYMRNALGNALFFAPAQGMLPTVKMAKTWFKEIGRKKGFFLKGKLGLQREAVDAYYSELSALGILNDEVRPKMIDELLLGETTPQGMMDKISENIGVLAKKNPSKAQLDDPNSTIGKLYLAVREMSAAMDTYYKIYYFEHELDVLKKAKAKQNGDKYEAMSEYDLKRAASDIVKATAQSYSQAVPLVRGLAKSPYGVMFAPFIRFKGEVVRIVVNTLRIGVKEIRDSNPVIFWRGVKRLTGLSSVMIIGSAGISTVLRKVAGMTEEDEMALRRLVPEYLRSHTFWFARNEKGGISTYDMTYINPFSQLADPFLRAYTKAFAGESVASITSQFVKTLVIDEYFDEQIFSGAFISVIKNRDPQTGKKIVEDREDPLDAFGRQAQYILEEAFEPRTLKAMRDISAMVGADMTMKDIFNRIGKEFKPVSEYEIDFYQRLQGYLHAARLEGQQISLRKNIALRDIPLSNSQLRQLVLDEMDHKRRIDKEIMQTVNSSMGMGNLSQEQIDDAVRRAKFGQRRWGNLKKGLTETPLETIKGLKDRLNEKAERTGQAVFARRAKYLDAMYRSLPRTYKFDTKY